MIQQPDTLITYRIKDASIFWHICDDSINVYDTSCEDGICIHGIDANAIFQMMRNAMCANQPCFKELRNADYQVDQAKEMITALTNYVNAREKATAESEAA
jgi:hypothetical protein